MYDAELDAGGKTNVGYGYFNELEVHIAVTGHEISPAPQSSTTHPIIWENAYLTWNPGNMVLTAKKDDKRAEVEPGADRGMIPEQLHKKLFDKRKAVTARVTVEPIGNMFRIVKVEV